MAQNPPTGVVCSAGVVEACCCLVSQITNTSYGDRYPQGRTEESNSRSKVRPDADLRHGRHGRAASATPLVVRTHTHAGVAPFMEHIWPLACVHAVLTAGRCLATSLATSLATVGDIPRSLSPRWVAAKAREGSVCRAGCFLVALACWIALPFALLVVWRVHARFDAFDLEAALNETLAGVPQFELAVSSGAAVKLPPPEFRATLPPALFHLLADHADPVHYYGRIALQQLALWWQVLGDSWPGPRSRERPAGTWWRETQTFGVAGPDEFMLGELVVVHPPGVAASGRTFRRTSPGLALLWPTVGSERAKAAERLGKVIGVHPSRTLSDFSYTIVYCDGGRSDNAKPEHPFVNRKLPNCTATVDTALVDPKTRRGRSLRYGLTAHGARLAFVRATFGAPHTRIAAAEVALAEPADANGNLTNARALYGRVAVVRRGGCEFVDKAARIQHAGAIGMIIVNHEEADVKAGSAEGAAADGITIPVVT